MALHFEHLTGRVEVKVYDMTGKLMDQFQTNNDGVSDGMIYDTQGRADGMYLFVVTGKEGIVTKKVIVKR